MADAPTAPTQHDSLPASLWSIEVWLLFETDDTDMSQPPNSSLTATWTLMKKALDEHRRATEALAEELPTIPDNNTLKNRVRRLAIEREVRSYPEQVRFACSAFTTMIYSSLEDRLANVCRKLPRMTGIQHTPPERLTAYAARSSSLSGNLGS